MCVCQGRVNTQSHNLVHSLGKVSVFSGVDVKFQPDDFASQLLPLKNYGLVNKVT